MKPSDIVAKRKAMLARLEPLKLSALERVDNIHDKQKAMKGELTDHREEMEMVSNHPMDLFPTPPGLADYMVGWANDPCWRGGIWVEPSAGTGRIALAIRRIGIEPICVEFSYSAAQLLRKKGFTVFNLDFLSWFYHEHPTQVFIMNPPFSNGQDIIHVRYAFNLLPEGGRIVSIMSMGSFQRSDRQARMFQTWYELYGTHFEALSDEEFKPSGTMVKTCLVVIDKK